MNTKNTAPKPNSEVFEDAGGLQVSPDAKAQKTDAGYVTALGMESTEDMRHVAKHWQQQCTPLFSFMERIHNEKQGKSDVYRDESYIRLQEDLSLLGGERFTPQGLTSLVTKYTNLPLAMLNYLYGGSDDPAILRADYKVLAQYINRELEFSRKQWRAKHDRDRELLLRLRDDEGTAMIRMVASSRYGIVDNDEVLNYIHEAFMSFGKGGYVDKALTSHGHSNGDTMHGNILLPDQMKTFPDSDYGVGIAFSNSEIGTDTVNITPFLFRAICMNGCIWGRKNSMVAISKKHLGEINTDDLGEKITYVVSLALDEGNDLLQQMQYSKEAAVPENKVESIIAYLSRDNGLTIAQGKQWNAGYQEEPIDSGFGVVNALTRAARRYTGEQRWDLECLAGKMLTPDLKASQASVVERWAKIVDRASDLDRKVVEQYISNGDK